MSSKDQQFDSLVKCFYQPLYRYAFWTCKNRATAEDLVQETFARAWKSFHQLQDITSAKSWLFTILSRENARRFERKQLPISPLSEEWQLEQIADSHDDLETMMTQRAILKLPLQFREPLALQVIGGFSTEEIAKVLDINLNTTSTRLFRARAELKQQLTPQISKGNQNG